MTTTIADLRAILGANVGQFTSGLKEAAGEAQHLGAAHQAANPHLQETGEASNRVGSAVEGLKDKIGSLLGPVAALGTGLGAAFELKEAIGKTQEIGNEVFGLQMKMGLAADQASVLRFQMEETGVSYDSGVRGLDKFQKALAGVSDLEDGVTIPVGKSMADMLKSLGVEAEDSSGKSLPLTTVMGELADKFQAMPNGAEKTALAMNLFGKSGVDLIPMLNKGRDGLAELTKEADKFGLVLDQKSVDAMRKQVQAGREMHAAFDGIQLQIGLLLMPLMTLLATKVTELAVVINQYVVPALQMFGDYMGSTVVPVMQQFAESDVVPKLEEFGAILRDVIVPAVVAFASAVAERLSGPLTSLMVLLGGKEEMLKDLGIAIGGALVAAFTAWAVSAGAAAVATVAAMLPVLAIGAAIALLVTGIVWLVRNWADLEDRYSSVRRGTEMVRSAFEALTSWIRTPFIPDVEAIARVFELVGGEVVSTVSGHWDQIRAVMQTAWDLVVNYLRYVWDVVKAVVQGGMEIIQGVVNIVMGLLTGDWSRAWDGVKEVVTGVWRLISGIVGAAIRLVRDDVVTVLTDLGPTVRDLGSDLVKGIWEGISAMGSWLKDKFTGFLGDVMGGAKKFLGIGSPSKVAADELGTPISQGVAQGIQQGFPAVNSMLGSLVGLLNQGATLSAGYIQSIMSAAGITNEMVQYPALAGVATIPGDLNERVAMMLAGTNMLQTGGRGMSASDQDLGRAWISMNASSLGPAALAGASAKAGLNIDMSGSTFLGHPEENGSAIAQAVQSVIDQHYGRDLLTA